MSGVKEPHAGRAFAGATSQPPKWLAAIEGFYGPPLSHEARLDLLPWLPSVGFTDFAYGPKDDPFHRAEWRSSYPAEHLDRFAQTLATAHEAGIELTLSISPGLDWRGADDHADLVRKLRQLYDVGVRSLGVYWDDVVPGGEDLGRSHAEGVAAAVRGLPDDVRWITVGTDYAMSHVTPYLAGFAAALPPHVSIAWTGPAVTSVEVPTDVAVRLAEELDHPLLFCDNFPVNDLGMSPVLHLGPAPAREPALRDVVAGAGFNMMSHPLASRIGLASAARHWLDPDEDRERAWLDIVASFPGVEPIARASRSWLDSPGPAPELLEWALAAFDGDPRLLDYLQAGCRDGLPTPWQDELEPWLATWEAEARVLAGLVRVLQGGPLSQAPDLGVEWPALHRRAQQVFGIRLAVYGLTYRAGDTLLPHPDTVVRGENLTDLLVRTALERMHDAAVEAGAVT